MNKVCFVDSLPWDMSCMPAHPLTLSSGPREGEGVDGTAERQLLLTHLKLSVSEVSRLPCCGLFFRRDLSYAPSGIAGGSPQL
jgi:hypothetical protein